MSRHPLSMRILYFIIALAILPATVSLTYIILHRIVTCSDFIPNMLLFIIGFVSYLVFFVAFRKPMLAYVFGHELTHALWVVLFRGKVKSIKVTKNGGAVRATKSNPLIILAPYFFPLYTLIVIGLWMLFDYLAPIGRYFSVAVFLVGFTWSFHVLLNLYILREAQSDIHAVGFVFSTVTVFALNILTLGLLAAFVSDSISYKGLFIDFRHGFLKPYMFVTEWAIKAWHYLRTAFTAPPQ